MHNTFTLAIAKNLVDSSEQFPVDFDLAWEWLEYSRRDTAKNCLTANFVEGLDYVRLRFNMESDNHAGLSAQEKATMARKKNFNLTVDCFKTWAMMAKTEKGKQVRLYFLECEKIAKATVKQPALPANYLEALKALVASEEEKLVLQTKLIEAQPKIEYADAVACSDNAISMNDFAKLIGTGRTRLFKQLRDLKIIMQSSTLPYQRWMDSGFFEVGQVITYYGVEPYALVTGKGQLWLCQKLGLTAKQVSQLSLF